MWTDSDRPAGHTDLMGRQRTKDRLVGAATAVLLLLAVVGVVLLRISEPGAEGVVLPQPSPTTAEPRRDGRPPSDLAEGETWLDDLVLEADSMLTPDSPLRDVRAVGRDVRTGPGGLEAGTLSVEATVPFDVVAEQLGKGITVTAAGRSAATVVRSFDVAGRRLSVVSTGTVDVVAGRLVVEPRSIDVGGPAVVSKALADVARELVTIEHSIEGLPDGLVLQDVTVQEDGFRARLRGRDVRLAPPR